MPDIWLSALVALWIIVAVQSFFLAGVLRQLGLIQLRLGADPGTLITAEGLERGAEAPDFTGDDVLTDEPISLSRFRGRRVLLFFVTPTCSACKELTPHINVVAKEWPEVAAVTVCYGTRQATYEFARLHALRTPVVVDETNAIAEQYDVRYTPFVYLLDEHGRVRVRGLANNWPQLERLIEEEGTLQNTRRFVEVRR